MIKTSRRISQRRRIAVLLLLQGGLLVAVSLWTSLSFHIHGLLNRQTHLSPLLESQQRQGLNPSDIPVQRQIHRKSLNYLKSVQQGLAKNVTAALPVVPKSQHDANISVLSRDAPPAWLQNYTKWHQQQIERFEKQGLEAAGEARFLILRCLQGDTNCGGTADRLKPWPLVVRLAAQMKRVVWILWERPCRLEEFLVPPHLSADSSSRDDSLSASAIDWRVLPDVLQRVVNRDKKYNSTADLPSDWTRSLPLIGTIQDIETILNSTGKRKQRNKRFKMWARHEEYPVVTMLFQSHDHGSEIYNTYKDQAYFEVQMDETVITSNPSSSTEPQPTYEQVFRSCWKTSFLPSHAVQSRIDQSQSSLGIQTDHYVAAHIRSLYQQAAGPKKTVFVAKNALHCASQLRVSKDEPILVATDAIKSTLAAIEYAAENHPTTVVVTPRPLDQSHKQNIAPLHLDRGSTFLSKNASEWTQQADPAAYYDTFVDLYLLANARCIAYHLGNYGKWANLLSSDPSCSINHFKKRCRWKEDY